MLTSREPRYPGADLVRRLNHPALPCLLVAALYGLVLMRVLERHDAAFFVQAGEQFVDTSQAPANLFTVSPFSGYDGQFYYRFAITPFSRENPAFGIRLDIPRYRHQRILYPLLAYAFSFGSPPLAIYSLILVNFLALAALGWWGGRYAQAAGRHAVWGAAFALYAGYTLSLARDLAEIVEALFVLAGLVALQRRSWLAAAGLLSLALLAKETALLVAVVLVGLWAWSRWRRTAGPPWYAGLTPITVYGLWQAWLLYWWRAPLLGAVGNNLGWPFVGLADGFQRTAAIFAGAQTLWIVEVGALVLFALGVVACLRRSLASTPEKLGWGVYLVLLLVLTGNVWIEDLAFLRAASLFYLFGLAVVLNTGGWLARAILIYGIGAWGALAAHWLLLR